MSTLFVQGVKVVVGIKNQPLQQPVVVAQDSDANILLSFFDQWGNYVDVSTATGLALKFVEADGVTILTITPTVVVGRVNQLLAAMVAANFALLPEGDNDAELYLTIDGVNYAINMYAMVTVNPAVA